MTEALVECAADLVTASRLHVRRAALSLAEAAERHAASRVPVLRLGAHLLLALQALSVRLRPLSAAAHRRIDGRTVRVATVASAAIALTGVVAATNLHATGQALIVRLPDRAPAAVAVAARPADGAASRRPAAPAATTAAPTPAPAPVPPPPAPAPIPPNARGALPVGKGMWIWLQERVENNDVAAVVARAQAHGISHLYVRTGTLKDGFYAAEYLNRLLPLAHAKGIRVYGWDFPYLKDLAFDVNRALAAINHTTPDGHRIDGFAADIELRSMGVNVTPEAAAAYGALLRKYLGPNYPLIAVTPAPHPKLVSYPFREVVASFDAIAPMTYWLGRDPGAHVLQALEALWGLGKPVMPVGQAYDGFAEGGPPGVPGPDQIQRFMQVAEDHGAISVSFWSWQHADGPAWAAIRDSTHFQLPTMAQPLTAGQLRAYQGLLTSLGFPVARTGVWDEPTVNAVRAYQQAARLPVTGAIDELTKTLLLTPFNPPIQPQL